MALAREWTGTTFRGHTNTFYGRVEGANRVNITQASVSSLTAKVFDYAGAITRKQIGSTHILTIADCVWDTLQDSSDDAAYTGTGGFNFRATVPGIYFRPDGTDDALVLVEFHFLDTVGNNIVVPWKVTVKEALGVA